jgi:hypothetical protein
VTSVFCLEGEWSGKLRDEQSVRPLLEVLRHTANIDFVHRRVATKAELARHLKRWRAATSYSTLYLAYHGEDGELELDEMVGLPPLAEMLGPSCERRVVHLSACQSLAVTEDAVDHFLDCTKADGLVGYKGSVGWIEGAALDLIVLAELAERASKARRPRIATLVGDIKEKYEGLVERTTFDGFPKIRPP